MYIIYRCLDNLILTKEQGNIGDIRITDYKLNLAGMCIVSIV
jgi:hypothetical protein